MDVVKEKLKSEDVVERRQVIGRSDPWIEHPKERKKSLSITIFFCLCVWMLFMKMYFLRIQNFDAAA